MEKVLIVDSPLTKYVGGFICLFDKDPEIDIEYNDDDINFQKLIIKTSNIKKAKILKYILNDSKNFENSKLLITVDSFDKKELENLEELKNYTLEDIFETVFEGNSAYSYCCEVEDDSGTKFIYVVFKCEVVQFFNNNLIDIYGITNTLYQDIAKKIFNINNVFYCTEMSEENSIQKNLPI